ncbi:MAG: hypothetical protein U9532_02660 ['Conium maculatum' witches'-broom phytoplasma]|nr:hypothetical protein ['Conium maculatum' witches'-broom phytoplasma]
MNLKKLIKSRTFVILSILTILLVVVIGGCLFLKPKAITILSASPNRSVE